MPRGGTPVSSPEIAPEVLGASTTRPPLRRPTARALWLTGLAGVVVVTGFSVLAATSGQLPHPAVGVLVVGWITVPYLVSGLIAWWRRPVSRLGPLMLAAGFVTPLSLLPFAEQRDLGLGRGAVRGPSGRDVPARLPGLPDRSAARERPNGSRSCRATSRPCC